MFISIYHKLCALLFDCVRAQMKVLVHYYQCINSEYMLT